MTRRLVVLEWAGWSLHDADQTRPDG